MVAYKREKNNILYLMLKRKLHWTGWEFPKGAIERNEKILPAVKRELFEETGQRPLIIKKFNFKGKFKYSKEKQEKFGFLGQTYTLFSAELKNKKIKIDKREHSSYKWLEFEKAISLLTYKDQKKCLKLVNDFLNKNEK